MTYPINTSVPATNNDPADDQPQMQTNFSNINSYLQVDHTNPANTGAGQHAQVTFNANNIPSPPVFPPILFTNTVAGLPQLFFYSGDVNHTTNQYTNAANGSTFVLGGMILKWGTGTLSAPYSSSGTSISFASAFPNNCYAVLAQTQDGGSGTTANTFAYARSFSTSAFNLLITFRASTGQPGSGSVNYTYIAIGN